ncbi:MAG: radical SAM protein [Pseudomonadota bacterium]
MEVTSACNAECAYCPHTAYRAFWKNRYLSLDRFRKLEDAFTRTRHVHLQGWGEPFLHPNFFDMVAIAKRAGCRVGTTTNGMCLDADHLVRIIDSGLDVIAFSLAGTDERNDIIRKGTRLDMVLNGMRGLSREKGIRNSKTPEIHVAYMLLKSEVAGLEHLPALLSDSGADQAVISTLDFVPSKELLSQTLIPKTMAEYEEWVSLLNAMARRGEPMGLHIHHYLLPPDQKKLFCTENVQKAVCVSSDGAVTPCVFTNLNPSGISYVSKTGTMPYERLVFGTIGEESLFEIRRKKSYAAFCRSFQSKTLFAQCRGCLKLKGSI